MKLKTTIRFIMVFFATVLLSTTMEVKAASILRFKPGISGALLYPTASSGSSYTYIHTSYGMEAAYLGYDAVSNRAKIRISGYTGWTPMTNIDKTNINQQLKVTATSLNIRSTPSTSGTKVGVASNGAIYTYSATKVADGYTWYQIDTNKWIANNASSTYLTIFGAAPLTYYTVSGGMLYHYIAYYSTILKSISINLGKAPTYLITGTKYYSFDGNYFYTDITKMLNDYVAGTFTNAINSKKPHYPYFMYLPSRSRTGYTASIFDSVITKKGYTKNKPSFIEGLDTRYVSQILPTVVGGTVTYEWTSEDRTNMSLMYGSGKDFIAAANTYGVNALMMFGVALNESASGTSKISFYKNNIFGIGAVDSDPINGARAYNDVTSSIFDYAKFTGASTSAYNNPVSDKYYYGTHYGNKGSGMNVKYASDPYWGEKQAQNSFNNDKNYGGYDNLSNVIGITNKLNVPLYKEPNGPQLYILKNNVYNKSIYNIPVIVFDKVTTYSEGKLSGWYKVYTDAALNSNRDVADVTYNFNDSYAYIKETDLYLVNQQTIINVSDKSVSQYESFDPRYKVTAIDTKDGDVSSNIEVTENTVNTNVQGSYIVTYRVTNSLNNTTEKAIIVKVIGNTPPVINATDQKVYLNTTYNPKFGVSVKDNEQGMITNLLTITANNVDTTQIGTYSVTYSVTDAAGNKVDKTINVNVVNRPTTTNISSYSTNYNGVSLYWKVALNATSYELYYATASNGRYVRIATTTKNSYYHGGLVSGRTYYYKIKPVGYLNGTSVAGSLNSPLAVTIRPATPGSSIRKVSNTALRFQSSAVAGANGYEYYMATSARGTYSRIATTSRTYVTKYSLSRKRTYYYKVRAYRWVNSQKVYSNFSIVRSYYMY